MRTQREVTLPISVDPASEVGLPEQIVDALRGLLVSGALGPGDDLPSTRALASHLGVARGTVVRAFDQLLAEGWFEAVPGRSTRVNPRLSEVHPTTSVVPRQEGIAAPASAEVDLRPGRPRQSDLNTREWRAAWKRAAQAPLDVTIPVLGWMPLREAIAAHLRRMRALVRDPAQIVVTAGTREGLSLLMLATGARSVGVEDPGYPSLRRVPPRLGASVVSLPTDEHGLVTSALPDDAPDAMIVTPSHQYPLGGSLPIDRRQQLLAWAQRRDVLVIEDDYDSELRYTSAPLPTLTSLDADGRVALLGTFSKILTPALSVGYAVVPPALVGAVEDVRREMGRPVDLVTQRAVADVLESGALGRHTQRMRNLYRRRRGEVIEAFRGLDGVRVYPMDGGLHAVVEVDADEDAMIAALLDAGVRVSALSEYWSDGRRTGLVFGFGEASDADLARALASMRRVLGAPSVQA